jgi:hypothetical protein
MKNIFHFNSPENNANRTPESPDTELVCYCFQYTGKDIEDDFLKHGRSSVLEKILAEKKTGGCQCAEKNPKGR